MKYEQETVREYVIKMLERCKSPEFAAQQLGRLARERFPFHVTFREKPWVSYSEDDKTRRARFVLATSSEDTSPIEIDVTVTMD